MLRVGTHTRGYREGVRAGTVTTATRINPAGAMVTEREQQQPRRYHMLTFMSKSEAGETYLSRQR